MTDIIQIGEISIEMTRKNVKHVHLSVYPPAGRVRLVAPMATRLDVARAYAISRLGWIRSHQARIRSQARETPRQYVERESHYIWGRQYLLTVIEKDEKPSVRLSHRRIFMTVRSGTGKVRREEIMQEWHRSLLHEFIPQLIKKWEAKLVVTVSAYFLQRMKTRWGGCNHRAGNIRINTDLVKKPKDLVEYVVVHEMIHLLEPKHNERFMELIGRHYRSWREARAELNELPLSAETWRE